ncbi:MAG: hypothetical protein V3S16_15305, partial [Candidatus Desulfatibia sp.]|uniref:hypothetical protein n=1 Tax=Candidatus Desulfatibia sp. TaxID=3101189 RepID=UPI002F2EFDE2
PFLQVITPMVGGSTRPPATNNFNMLLRSLCDLFSLCKNLSEFEAKFFKLSLILNLVIDSVLQREEKAFIIVLL